MDHIVRRREVLGVLAASVAPLVHGQGEDYPNRPIRLFVGYAAGGGVDTMARIVGQRLGAALGQSFIVENRTGASGLIAADAVAKSPADGYTLLYGESGLLITPHLQGGQLDPLKAFAPVGGTFRSRLMIIANSKVPVNNPKELIALLRQYPGKYSYGTSGVGTVHHLGLELLKAQTNTHAVHVPYRGAAQIIPDVINGELPFAVVSAAAAVPQQKAGRLKIVASLSTKMPGAESIATMSEALPGFDVAPRQMLLAPAGTPQSVIEKVSAALRELLASSEVAELAEQQGVVPAYAPPDVLGKEITRESADWTKVIHTQNIKTE